MAALDINNFILSLAVAIGELAGIEAKGTPRAIWAHEAIEAASTDVYSVLRVYGGPAQNPFGRRDSASVQVDTRAKAAGSVLTRARAIEAALVDSEQRARFDWVIEGWRIGAGGSVEADPEGSWFIDNIEPVGVPGITGRDAEGRWMASFSMDVWFDREGT